MQRPYVICHMLQSVDGKVTGGFLSLPETSSPTEMYYELNRAYKADAFACGRVTMEGSFTGGYYPDLTRYEPRAHGHGFKMDCLYDEMGSFFAVCFDPKGKLGWKSNRIIDDDPGYGGALIVEVLTEQVDPRYLTYLEEMEIPYIFAGETEIDVDFALFKLWEFFGIKKLLLEGGSIINGYFQRAGVIDELSLVVVPTVGGRDDKPLFFDSTVECYKLAESKLYPDGTVWLNYKKEN